MDSLVRIVGLVLRFPFFLAGLFFVTVVWIPFQLICSIAMILWTPVVFLKAAFRNDPSELKFHLDMAVPEKLSKSYEGVWNRWLRGW